MLRALPTARCDLSDESIGNGLEASGTRSLSASPLPRAFNEGLSTSVASAASLQSGAQSSATAGDVLDDQADLESLKRAAYEACLAEVEGHLEHFLRQRAYGSYEEWIGELHPENVRATRQNGEPTIDERFYIEGSDHRRLWNARVDWARHVPARTKGRRGAAPNGAPAAWTNGQFAGPVNWLRPPEGLGAVPTAAPLAPFWVPALTTAPIPSVPLWGQPHPQAQAQGPQTRIPRYTFCGSANGANQCYVPPSRSGSSTALAAFVNARRDTVAVAAVPPPPHSPLAPAAAVGRELVAPYGAGVFDGRTLVSPPGSCQPSYQPPVLAWARSPALTAPSTPGGATRQHHSVAPVEREVDASRSNVAPAQVREISPKPMQEPGLTPVHGSRWCLMPPDEAAAVASVAWASEASRQQQVMHSMQLPQPRVVQPHRRALSQNVHGLQPRDDTRGSSSNAAAFADRGLIAGFGAAEGWHVAEGAVAARGSAALRGASSREGSWACRRSVPQPAVALRRPAVAAPPPAPPRGQQWWLPPEVSPSSRLPPPMLAGPAQGWPSVGQPRAPYAAWGTSASTNIVTAGGI